MSEDEFTACKISPSSLGEESEVDAMAKEDRGPPLLGIYSLGS